MADQRKRWPIGALIRRAMKGKRVDQGEAATGMGVSRSALNSWINDRAYPQDWNIPGLDEYLGIRIEEYEYPPAIVTDNADFYEVRFFWNNPDLTRTERVGLVTDWLRRNHPERLEDGEPLTAP